MHSIRVVLLIALTLALGGCEAIVDIFQAGFWVGVIAIVAILGVIAFVVMKIRR